MQTKQSHYPKDTEGMGRKGSLSVPLLLSAVILVTAGAGLSRLLKTERTGVEHQLRIDRCAARYSRSLRRQLESIERTNQIMRSLRISAGATAIFPPANRAIRAAMEGLAQVQDNFLRSVWRFTIEKVRIASMVNGCHITDGLTVAEGADWPWLRLPEDPIGPMPLQYSRRSQSWQIEARHRITTPRRATAVRISSRSSREPLKSQDWRIDWVVPEDRLSLR